MRIKMREAIAGHADERYDLDDHSFRPGEIVDVNDALAQAWLDSGVAVLPDPEPPPVEENEPHTHHKKAPKSAR